LGKGPKREARHNIALKYKIEARYVSSNISVGHTCKEENIRMEKNGKKWKKMGKKYDKNMIFFGAIKYHIL
jgi:hypothetical protein